MNHRIKTLTFKILNIMPGNIGIILYHFLQNFSYNKNISVKFESSEETYKSFSEICKDLNIEQKNNVLIEIGSGWLPIMPYLFIYKGKMKCIFTYDMNKHFQKKAVKNFNSLFSKRYNYNIIESKNSLYSLPVNINYYPNQNIIHANLPMANLIFSRFVLEHVTPDDIFEMHKKFKNSQKKGTYIIHFISPSDHRAYTDESLSLQDFLKYSKREWDSIQTKFDYHNRLRLPQYLEIFSKLDFEILHLEYDTIKIDSIQEKLFNNLEIHSDYKKYNIQELTAGSIKIVLKV